MPDNPRKKKQDRKRQSQQKHEVAYRNRARGTKSQSRKSSRSRRSPSNRSRSGQRSRSQSRTGSNRTRHSMSMRELLTEEMADIYNAEKQLLRALPKLARAATSEQLRTAFEQHLDETQEQVRRIEQAFEALGERPKSKKCDAMEGLIKEGEHIMEEDFDGSVLDAALIAAAQKVEHYEIASYGTLCAFAKVLEETEAGDLLMETLNEEKEADSTLSEVAESSINIQAAEADEEDEEEEEGNGQAMAPARSRAKKR